MVNMSLKKEEQKNICIEEGYLAPKINSNDEDLFSSFESLEVEEARIIEQKEHLTTLLNELEIKAKAEVERKKQKVEKLYLEVEQLKLRCKRVKDFISCQ